MKIVDLIPNTAGLLRESAGIDWDRALFFDIETTGLNWRRSHLYLIGAMWLSEGKLRFRQWFAEKPSDEEAMLRLFLQLAAGYKTLVHYNGTTFDIPYLCHKATFYQLDPLPLMDKSCDLYQQLRPLKKLLGLENMKLKTLECALGLHRRDTSTGEELIQVYKGWIASRDPGLQERMLLHNEEDVTGMARLQTLYTLLALRQGALRLELTACEDQDTLLKLTLKPGEPVPVRRQVSQDGVSLELSEEELTLAIPKYTGTLKHYYPDYKNYYYLPAEDRAIHKSVGVYVEPDYREKARPDTCYSRHTGTFLPQPDAFFTPEFHFSRNEKSSWFLYKPSLAQDTPALLDYAYRTIKALLS